MYKIIKNNTTIGLAETPIYVMLLDNGYWGLCQADEAGAVVYGGVVYPLEEVLLVETDAGTVLREQEAVQSMLFVAAAEQGALNAAACAEHPDFFAAWEPHIAYSAGSIRRYGGALYRCVQAHTSQEDWLPDLSPSLWTQIADPAEDWPAWGAPIGAHDAYQKGDRVSHDGAHWVSDMDNNVWEPGVYGWTLTDAV